MSVHKMANFWLFFFATLASRCAPPRDNLSPEMYLVILRFMRQMQTTLDLNSHVLVGFRKPKMWQFADLDEAISAQLFKFHFCTE